MRQTLYVDGEVLDEHTIHVKENLKAAIGKVKLIVEMPDQQETDSASSFEQYFRNQNLDLKGFKFNRDSANER